MSGHSWKLRWIFLLLLILIAAMGAAVFIGSAPRSSFDCVTSAVGTNATSVSVRARAVGTNVTSVSVRVTQGPTHTFYYPSRLRWEWDRARRRLGLPVKSRSEAIIALPSPAKNVLWVAMTYREKLPVLNLLVVEEVGDGGRIRTLRTSDGLLDESRRASVSKWSLGGDVERYRGKTLHIRTMTHGKEMAIIEFQ